MGPDKSIGTICTAPTPFVFVTQKFSPLVVPDDRHKQAVFHTFIRKDSINPLGRRVKNAAWIYRLMTVVDPGGKGDGANSDISGQKI